MIEDTRIQVKVLHREPLLQRGILSALQQNADICLLDAASASDDLPDVIVADYESALRWFGSRRHTPRATRRRC